MTSIPDIALIAKQLGKAKPEGECWRCRCPAHDDNNPSLSLGWDKITQNLLARCWAGCRFDEVTTALRNRGLLHGKPNNRKSENFSFAVSTTPKISNEKSEMYLKIWNGSIAADGLYVEKYLNSRGYYGCIPPTIRFSPKLYHSPSKAYHPAMVSGVTMWPEKRISGIHRTYLAGDGSDKAPISPNKMMLGNTKGGAVRLSTPDKTLFLAEGIETALSIYAATSLPTWATLSTSGMVNVKVPPLNITQKIIIAADNDAAGKKAADTLAKRLSREGYKIHLALPPPGMDFNDMLRRQP